MYRRGPAPTNQKAGARPISFLLDNLGILSEPVFLTIRPEDLTRTEPSRVAVHQTLGRDVAGWVDNFGRGLPSVTIVGHTGWRATGGAEIDGATAFERLNQLVQHDFHAAKQAAIDAGVDPAMVRLLFVDTLDQFAWSVVPQTFVLRRSRSRPLLFQYNIVLQAVSDSISPPVVDAPIYGDVGAAIGSMDGKIDLLMSRKRDILGWVEDALKFVDGNLGPVTAAIGGFVDTANSVFVAVQDEIRGANDLATGVANRLIGVARQVATVGVNIFRTINAISNLPGSLKAKIGSVAAAYNEMLCIFSNALKPRKVYEQYTGLYGASNCSSTVGGRPPSTFLNTNVFEQMVPDSRLAVTGEAVSALTTLGSMDPVLSPLPLQELGRLSSSVAGGIML